LRGAKSVLSTLGGQTKEENKCYTIAPHVKNESFAYLLLATGFLFNASCCCCLLLPASLSVWSTGEIKGFFPLHFFSFCSSSSRPFLVVNAMRIPLMALLPCLRALRTGVVCLLNFAAEREQGQERGRRGERSRRGMEKRMRGRKVK
jgi:hypothetical protein